MKSVVICVLLASICGIFLQQGILIPNEPSLEKFPVRGIDLSHHNGAVEWDQISKDEVHFVFLKATEGTTWQDRTFRDHAREARARGIVVGAYHFFSTMSRGASQAHNFKTIVPRDCIDLAPVIDVEFLPEQSHMAKEDFLREFEVMRAELRKHYGKEPIIYTDDTFFANYLQGVNLPRIWIRSITSEPSQEFEKWEFWQYSSRGRVQGVTGRVDLNVYRGDSAMWKSLVEP